MPNCRQRAASPCWPPEVSIRITAPASSGSRLTNSATANPFTIRHLRIEEDHRKGVPGSLALLQQVQGALPSLRLGRYHFPAPQHLHQEVTVGRVIVHYQGRKVSEPGKFRPARGSDVAPQAKPSGKMKGATVPSSAFHPDSSPHQFHQMRGDRQAQSCAAIPARC